MDFNFSDEQLALAKMVRTFATEELLPKYAYWDRNGEFPREQVKKMGDLGLLGLRVDPQYGGLGVDCVTAGLVRGFLFMDDVEVPAENLVRREGGGFEQVMQAFDYTRALIGLQCVGAAQITLEETIQYVKDRTAFGKPISNFEGVLFPIAEWAAKLEMVRWLCYRTLWLRDQGLPIRRRPPCASGWGLTRQPKQFKLV